MTELAVGYVSISATTRGLGASIEREFRGIESSAVGHGRRIGTQVAKGFQASEPVDVKHLEQNFTDSEKRRAKVVKTTTESIDILRRKEAIAQSALADAQEKQSQTVVKARQDVAAAEQRYGKDSNEARAARERLTAAEAKAATDSTAVLRAKDRLATASQKVAIAEAKAEVEVKKATDSVNDAKVALEGYRDEQQKTSSVAGTAFRGITTAAGTMARGVGVSLKQIATGDFRGLAENGRAAFESIKGHAKNMGTAIGTTVGTMGRNVGTTIGDVGRGIGDTFRKIATGDVKGAWENIKAGASTAADGVKGAFEKMRPGIAGVFDRIKGLFTRTADDGEKKGVETGKKFSKGLDREFESGARSAGNIFTSTLGAILASKAITGIVSKVTGMISGAFSRGWNRVLSIQEAEIKLGTIFENDSKKVKAAMDSVGKAVDGTKFAISDAADMASQLASSNMEAGDEMTRWLTITADAAQFTNREFSDMQSVIGRVASEGRVGGEVLQQLPIAVGALSKELGKTPAEIRKLASEGKISAEQFATAMESQIGGAAQNAGASFQSVRDNFFTAMAASTASILTHVESAVRPVLAVGIDMVKGFRKSVAEPLGEMLGAWLQPRAEAFAETLKRLPDTLGRIRDVAVSGYEGIKALIIDGDFTKNLRLSFGIEEDSGFVVAVQRIREMVVEVFRGAKDAVSGFIEGFGGLDQLGGIFKDVLPLLLGPVGIIKDALLDVFSSGGGGVDFKALGRDIGAALKPVAQLVGELAKALSGGLAAAFKVLLPAAMDIGKVVLDVGAALAKELVPVLSGLVKSILPVFSSVLSTVTGIVSDLVRQLAPLITSLVQQLAPVIGDLAAKLLPPLGKIISVVVEVVGALAQALIPVISTLVSELAPIVTSLVSTVIPPLSKALDGVATVLKQVVMPIVTATAKILADVLGKTIKALMPVVKTAFDFIGRTVKNVMNVVSGIIKTVMSLIRGDWSGAWDGIKRVASAVWDQIKNVVSTAVNLLKKGVEGVLKTMAAVISGIWDGIKRVGSAAWNWIRDTAIDVFGRMSSRVQDTFGKMRDAVGRIWDGITDKVKKPINVVIGFINKGVIGSYNWVADKLPGLKKLSNIQKLQDGGYVNRPWSATNRDPYLGMIGNGRGLLRFEGEEFIVNRQQARKHRGLLEAINRGDDMHVPAWATDSRKGIPAYAKGGVVRPVPQRHSGWNGGRYRSGGYHGGLDFPAPTGTPVRAMWPGSVSRARRMNTSYGNHVIMDHGGGLQTLYAHMSSILTAVGRAVGAGGTIGRVGSTGNSTGPHLHLEVRRNGTRVNPEPYLSGAIVGSADGPENPFTKWLSDAMSKITGPFRDFQRDVGTGMIADIAKGVAGSVKGSIESWVKDKLNPLNWFGGYASGTVSASPGWSWVGERGPELVNFRGGERVVSHVDSLRAMSDGRRSIRIDQMNLQMPDWVKDFDSLVRFLESFELEAHRS